MKSALPKRETDKIQFGRDLFLTGGKKGPNNKIGVKLKTLFRQGQKENIIEEKIDNFPKFFSVYASIMLNIYREFK